MAVKKKDTPKKEKAPKAVCGKLELPKKGSKIA